MDRAIGHRARWVHPVVMPAVADGGVLVRGDVILAVGRWREIAPQADEVVDHGDVRLTPGLINAHAHLELTSHGAIPAAGGLPDWMAEVARRSRAMADDGRAGFQRAADLGAETLRQSGTAVILDSTLWGVRAESSAAVLPAYEFISYTSREDERPFWSQVVERAEADERAVRLSAVEPHTPYTVHPDLIRRARDLADRHGRLFAIHLAEIEAEAELSAAASGPLADLIAANGGDPADYGGNGRTPAQHLGDLGVLDHAVLFHGNYLDAQDLPLLLKASASVVYCPRSHRHFGHSPHPAASMLSRGVNVCLGTDGLVSNEGLDMREEMRCAVDRCPGLSPDDALMMATLCGARALGIDGEYGALARGMRAVFAEIPEALWPGDA